MEMNKKWFARGMRDGVPIALGYFAVAFTLGIAAKNAGLTGFQAFFASLLLNASAGEYAGFSLIAAGAGYLEVVLMEAIANARYLLMSAALSQKLDSKTSLLHRLIIGYDVTDEIFGISVAVEGKLNPFYNYGAMTLAIPGWSLGTLFGVLMGNILPVSVVSALSVGLFGMFIAIIIPPARKDKIIAGLIIVSMALSFLFAKVELLSFIPEGVRVIILTVTISLGAAFAFPIKEEQNG